MRQQSSVRFWKTLSVLLAIAILGSLLSGAVFAADTAQSSPEIVYIVVSEDPTISIEYNGIIQSLQNEHGEQVVPVTFMGTTYLPVRAISNILGNDVEWVGETRTIRLIP